MVSEPVPFRDFSREIAEGNLNRAFNCLFQEHPFDSKLCLNKWANASKIFLDIVHRRAYHSKEVCNRIRDRLIALNVLTKQQVEKLQCIDIPEPCHPGVIVPCVTANGDGILIYAASKKTGEFLGNNLGKRYKILEPEATFKKIVKNISMKFEKDFLLSDRGEAVFYRLVTGFQDNRFVKCWNSAALSAALALVYDEAMMNIAADHKDFPKAATGEFYENGFHKPEKVIEKYNLIKDECPEIAFIAIGTGELPPIEKNNPRFKILADIHELVSEASRIIQAHPPDAERLEKLHDTIKGSDDNENSWRYVLWFDKYYDLCALPPVETEENESPLPQLLLTCFATARKAFYFDYALKFADRISGLIHDSPEIFPHGQSNFFAKCAVLHTALYQHEKSLHYIKNTNLDSMEANERNSTRILFGECTLLAGKYAEAQTWFESIEPPLRNKDKRRLKIYQYRLRMNQNITEIPEDLKCIPVNLKSKQSYLPFLYYVKARLFFLNGRYSEVLDIVKEAESAYCDPTLSIWPGILWRRYGGLAAEVLKNYTAAKKLLTQSLPEKYVDRFILNVHSAASHLLWWSMQLATDGYEAAGSPKPIAEPLYHELVRHHFEEDIETLVNLWNNRDSVKKIREQVEIIVKKSYE